ncbi:MAG: ComF family protein [bacterium]|nr:ComF family protein [bacterium]
MPLVDNLLKTLLDFLYPISCLSCGLKGDWLCPECEEKLPQLEAFACPVCLRPAIDGFTHPVCRSRNAPDRLICFFPYKNPLKKGIWRLKYGRRKLLADFFARLITKNFPEFGLQFGPEAVLIPVPLHWTKRWLRGFNQSELLAESLGKILGVGVWSKALVKKKNTKSQTQCTQKQREENVKGSLMVNPQFLPMVAGKDFILVDDVVTTGNTLREACRVLKKAGAKYVYLLAIVKG